MLKTLWIKSISYQGKMRLLKVRWNAMNYTCNILPPVVGTLIRAFSYKRYMLMFLL